MESLLGKSCWSHWELQEENVYLKTLYSLLFAYQMSGWGGRKETCSLPEDAKFRICPGDSGTAVRDCLPSGQALQGRGHQWRRGPRALGT